MASILITGVNRGIGLGFVQQLANSKGGKWKHVFAACRNPDEAEELKKLSAIHPSVIAVELDVQKDSTIEAAVKQVSSVVGDNGLNVLMNNAGIARSRRSLSEVNREVLLETFDVNAAGALIVTQKFLPLLRQGAAASEVPGFSLYRGAIFNMSSAHGSIGDNKSGGMYAYRMSKAALNMLTMSLSVDLKADNILAVSLVPGSVQTDMGGSRAPLTVEDSVSNLLKVLTTIGEKENGKSVDYKGEIYPN